MKQELKDIVYELSMRTTPATWLAWWSGLDVNQVLAGILLLLQIAFLIWKWYRMRTQFGNKIRGAVEKFSKPMELDE